MVKLGAPIGAIIMLKMLVEYVQYYIQGTNATITLIHLNSDKDWQLGKEWIQLFLQRLKYQNSGRW